MGRGSEGFVNGEDLVSTAELADRLDAPDLVVVDTRNTVEVDSRGQFRTVPGREGFLAGHVPGAVHLDLDELRDPAEPTSILPPDRFAEAMEALGVGDDREVVVYDTEGGTWAARLWWALRYHGHDRVRLLDGGYVRWVDEDRPVETGPARPPAATTFTPRLRPDLRVTTDEVLAALDDPTTVIVDALPRPFYEGRISLYPGLRAGHIPGARNVPAPENLDPTTWRLRSPAELARRWEPLLDGRRRVITYCGGGVYGAFDLFVLHLLGHDAALYDGSWEAWAAKDELPIETGPDPRSEP